MQSERVILGIIILLQALLIYYLVREHYSSIVTFPFMCIKDCPHFATSLKPAQRIPAQLNNVSMDNPVLIEFIRKNVIEEPFPITNIYKISRPGLIKTTQAEIVDKLFKGQDGLYFVECGAQDGERSSNTLWLERTRKWRGLLVEMDPFFYQQLRGKNRKSHSANVCLSPKTRPLEMLYRESDAGRGNLIMEQSNEKGRLVTCYPLYSLLLALNRTHVDYFSLDVEGVELDVLETIPFDKVNISVLTVEYVHLPQGEKALEDFMLSKGYLVYGKIIVNDPRIAYWADDMVFIKKDFVTEHTEND